MKPRQPIKRSGPPKRTHWNSSIRLSDAKPPKLRKPVQSRTNRKRVKKRKDAGLVYGRYHDWIGTLPCEVRGRRGHVCEGKVRGHHVKHVANGGVDYANQCPLCDGAHTLGPMAVHVVGRDTFAGFYAINLKARARSYADIWEARHREAAELIAQSMEAA